MMLILLPRALAGVAEDVDPIGFATDGQVGFDAELTDPARIAEVDPSGWMSFGNVSGFDAAAVGRWSTGRLFLGWEHEGLAQASEVKGVKDESTLESVDDAFLFGLAGRAGAFSGSLTGALLTGRQTLTGSGGLDIGASQVSEGYEESGTVSSTTFSGLARGEWSQGDGETRPRVGLLLGYGSSASTVDYEWKTETESMTYEGDWSAVSSGNVEGGSSNSPWTFRGGVRGGVEFGGTRDDPKSSLWAQVAGGGGGAGIPTSSIVYKSGGDSIQQELDASALHHELLSIGLGGYHRLGGPENSLWLGGRLSLGWDWSDGAESWSRGEDRGTSAYVKSAELSGALEVPLGARIAVNKSVRIWAGATPTLSFSSGENESHPAESGDDTDTGGTTTTTTTTTTTGSVDAFAAAPPDDGGGVRTTRSSSLGTSVDGRLGVEWHHESGVFAAIGLQMSSAAPDLGEADARIWFGWAPE